MMQLGGAPILVLSQNTNRESGRKVQVQNVLSAKSVSDVIRTCLGPRAMLKMLLDPMGGVVMTNDGNSILREITAQHPAAKTMIEISRTQDEEVGDGTTSVIVLAGELLHKSLPFLEENTHPTVIINGYRMALDDAITFLHSQVSAPVDVDNTDDMLKIIMGCLRTKVMGNWGEKACQIALDAVRTVQSDGSGRVEIDIKRYAKVEKIPGGTIEDSRVLDGVMLNKDVTHPKMRRFIKNPRIMLLDCNLEYKKGESQTEIEVSKEEDFTKILQLEEKYIQDLCADIIKFKPDVLFTEKGVSDLAQHYLVKANITAVRRVRKTDNNRIARACGATVVNRVDELKEEDIGTKAGLFKIEKIGNEYFCFVVECENPKACTILLRGASKDILAGVERSLQDAMCVARNVILDPYLVPGGGAVEMAVSQRLMQQSKSITGIIQKPYAAVASALEVIPRTLIQNCGGDVIRSLTALRAKHAASGNISWGIDGCTGQLVDMKSYGIWEPLAVKLQTYKTAVETAIMLLRIDDILSGIKKKEDNPQISHSQEPSEEAMKE